MTTSGSEGTASWRRVSRRAAARFVSWDLASAVSAIVVLAAITSVFVPGFGSAYNLTSLVYIVAVTSIVGLAQAAVLSVGQFNIALTGIGTLVAMFAGWSMQELGVPWPLSIGAGVALGAALGFVQGFVIVKSGINPFIVTLAVASLYFGAMLGLTRGDSFNRLPDEIIGFGRDTAFEVPVLGIISGVVVVACAILFGRTVLGRELLATGGNVRAALLSGIATKRMILIAHVLSGVLAAIAALLLLSRLGSAQASLGSGWLLLSFAAPVIGGSLLTGGKISPIGTVLGAALLAMIANALALASVSVFWFQAFLGVILLASVSVDRARTSYRDRLTDIT